MGVAGIDAIRTKGQAHLGISGNEQQVAVELGIDIMLNNRAVLLRHGSLICPVTQHGGRFGAQALGGILYALVPLLVIEVVAGGESIGGFRVEVIFRDGVIFVRNIGKGGLEVFADLLVHIGHVSTLIGGLQGRFRFGDVRNAGIFGTGNRVVSHAEHVYQDEVTVGTAQQRFGPFGFQVQRRILFQQGVDGFQGLIGTGNGTVAGAPDGLGIFVVAFRHIIPGEDVVDETVGIGVVLAVVVHVVGHKLGHKHIVGGGISRYEQGPDFLLGINLGAVIRHLVEELVAAGQDEGCENQNIENLFHIHFLLCIKGRSSGLR